MFLVGGGFHFGRLRGAEREQIGHAQSGVSPILRKRNAAPDCRVILRLGEGRALRRAPQLFVRTLNQLSLPAITL
jgi:hypothetical protein